jgi:hypothetical protein
MLVQKLKDLGFQGVVHRPSPNCETRTPALPMRGLTALTQVNTAQRIGGKIPRRCPVRGRTEERIKKAKEYEALKPTRLRLLGDPEGQEKIVTLFRRRLGADRER